jgi:hypothetical protein
MWRFNVMALKFEIWWIRQRVSWRDAWREVVGGMRKR